MQKASSHWPIYALEFLIVFLTGFVICNSDSFQSWIAPEKFWENKVHGLERNLKQIRWRVRELELALEHQKASEPYLIQQAVDYAKVFGNNTEQVAEQAKEDCEKKICQISDELRNYRDSLMSNEEELKFTIVKLHQAQDSAS